ncbi:LINE-1 reverse transcriptase, partial [Rhynchospora pubera]
NKTISRIVSDGTEFVGTFEILEKFTDFFNNLLGREVTTTVFEPATLFSDESELLNPLAERFSEFEIKKAVMGLANNKASGPDGLPNEFCKFNWDLVKQDLLALFNSLHNGTLDLTAANRANIVLLRKEDEAERLSDFRPISILCYLPKLISKVLNNRLAIYLPSIISSTQTGFIRGRLISENFIAAREIITHVSKGSDPAFLLKLDFKKAFDSVSWPFLLKILERRGFPDRFIFWIKLLLESASSSILLNGEEGPTFRHKRGLRQGDPLSPSLFIIAADVLSRMVQAASTSIQAGISRRLPDPYYMLQYADDTLVFSTTKNQAVRTLICVLHAFSNVSGIQLNLNKTALVPFNLHSQQCYLLQSLLGCPTTTLPIKYLGLPLTDRRPDRACFQSLIDKVASKLAGWKCRLLSRAGRIVLASSVLSSIPIYFMSVFSLPA